MDTNGEPSYTAVIVTTQKHLHEVKRDAFARGIIRKHGLTIEQQKLFKDNLILRHITESSSFDRFFKQDLITMAAELERSAPLRIVVIDNISTIVKQLEGGDSYSRHRRDKYVTEFYDDTIRLMRMGVHVVALNNLAANFKNFDDHNKLYKNVSSLGDLWTYIVTDKFELVKQSYEGKSNYRMLRTHFSKNGPKQDTLLEINDEGLEMAVDN